MNKIYWRPHKVSRFELVFVALLAALALLLVGAFQVEDAQPWYAEKLEASRLAQRALDVLREEHLRRGAELDLTVDPAGTALIGPVMSEITTNTGHLSAKQTTLNPNFAAVVVHYLKRLGVESGDSVAVGVSGSFPALNVAVYAALQTLGAKPIIVMSVSGSQWGANDPQFTWADMERVLFDKKVFAFRAVAASRGGIEDKGLGLSRTGRQSLDAAIERNGLTHLKPADYANSIEQRMAIFADRAAPLGVKVYINVGGGTTSVGTKVGKLAFEPGINRSPPAGPREIDSVMTRFVRDGVPIIHLVQVRELARRFGLPVAPSATPPPGEGDVFAKRGQSRLLAGGLAVAIIGLMFLFIRRDFGFRFLKSLGRGDAGASRQPPEQMV